MFVLANLNCKCMFYYNCFYLLKTEQHCCFINDLAVHYIELRKKIMMSIGEHYKRHTVALLLYYKLNYILL